MTHLLPPIKEITGWEAPCMIPVMLALLKERLTGSKTPIEWKTPLSAYREQCEHWRHADLNLKQREWLQEINDYINALEQRAFKPSLNKSYEPLVDTSPELTLLRIR